MTLVEFLESKLRNAWIREPGLKLYVRRTSFVHPRAVLVIASVDADEPGEGAFTRFLDRVEAMGPIVVESIINARLRAMLERRGYVMKGDPLGPSGYRGNR